MILFRYHDKSALLMTVFKSDGLWATVINHITKWHHAYFMLSIDMKTKPSTVHQGPKMSILIFSKMLCNFRDDLHNLVIILLNRTLIVLNLDYNWTPSQDSHF